MSAVERVFGTVELLDLILEFVIHFRDEDQYNDRWDTARRLLTLLRVNKIFHGHFFGETKVAQYFFLKPTRTRAKPMYLVQTVFPGDKLTLRNYIFADMYFIPPWHGDSMAMGFTIDRRKTKWEGQSWAKMLFSQPSVERMWMRVIHKKKEFCPYEPHRPPKKLWLIHREGGLTLGAISRAGREVLKDYPCCLGGWKAEIWASCHPDGSLVGFEERRAEEYVYIRVEA